MASQVVFVALYSDMANLARQYFLSAGDEIDVITGDIALGLAVVEPMRLYACAQQYAFL